MYRSTPTDITIPDRAVSYTHLDVYKRQHHGTFSAAGTSNATTSSGTTDSPKEDDNKDEANDNGTVRLPFSTHDSKHQVLTTASHTEVIEDLPLKQARELIGAVLNEVVTDNNKVLTQELRQTLTADIMQEMDFLVQAKERREEEHFRKLDQLIRQQQSIRRETVGHASPLLRLKRLLT